MPKLASFLAVFGDRMNPRIRDTGPYGILDLVLPTSPLHTKDAHAVLYAGPIF